jgi:hypothetical protein
MPALASLTINDREASPGTHIFTPANRLRPGEVKLRRAGVAPIADEYITLSSETLKDGTLKHTYKLIYPTVVTETINGVSQYKEVRRITVDVVIRASGQSTVQERKNALGLLYNSFDASKTVVNDAFMNNEGWV